jgi:hypothetical protein
VRLFDLKLLDLNLLLAEPKLQIGSIRHAIGPPRVSRRSSSS